MSARSGNGAGVASPTRWLGVLHLPCPRSSSRQSRRRYQRVSGLRRWRRRRCRGETVACGLVILQANGSAVSRSAWPIWQQRKPCNWSTRLYQLLTWPGGAIIFGSGHVMGVGRASSSTTASGLSVMWLARNRYSSFATLAKLAWRLAASCTQRNWRTGSSCASACPALEALVAAWGTGGRRIHELAGRCCPRRRRSETAVLASVSHDRHEYSWCLMTGMCTYVCVYQRGRPL